jgi:hypothetical protein
MSHTKKRARILALDSPERQRGARLTVVTPGCNATKETYIAAKIGPKKRKDVRRGDVS